MNQTSAQMFDARFPTRVHVLSDEEREREQKMDEYSTHHEAMR